jgi:hypothetical protein
MFDYFDFSRAVASTASVPAPAAPIRTSHTAELVTNAMR